MSSHGSPAPAARIEYFVETIEDGPFGQLHAKENGTVYDISDSSIQACMRVVAQRDFDGNGFTDALVADSPGCGGNCCADELFFVSANGGGRFEVKERFASSWEASRAEPWLPGGVSPVGWCLQERR